MLLRLMLFAAMVGGAIWGFRWWRAKVEQQRRLLSNAELIPLAALAARSEALRDALSLRERILGLGLDYAGEARFGVDEAVRELGLKAELAERLQRTADGLESDATEEGVRSARRDVDAAADDEARALAEERLAALQRQQASALELRQRRAQLLRHNERIVLALREVQAALLELQASTGQDAGGGVRQKLLDASDELRRQASAHDEVQSLLNSGGPAGGSARDARG